jgi:hypothetical protein
MGTSNGWFLRQVRRNNPTRQIAPMRAAFPGFRAKLGRQRQVTWRGEFQPTEHSDIYKLKVVYRQYGSPKVWVLAPKLHPKAPHLYPDGSLCLYWPKEWRWAPNESIAQTVMGWVAHWLYYYEMWLTIEEWTGPSSHVERPINEGRHE